MNMPKRRRFLFSAGALVLSLAGCAGLPGGLEEPRVSLADIRFSGGGLLEQRFRLTLRVHNPNDRDIPVEGLSFAVELNGGEFARGASNRPVVLTRLSDTRVEVEGVSNLSALLEQARRFTPGVEGRESLPYRLHGTLVGGPLGPIPFDRRGEIALPAEWPGLGRR